MECPRCGFESGPSAGECPLCGTRFGAASGELAGPLGAEGPIPWENPDAAFPANLLRTWRQSLFQPSGFFRSLDYAAPLGRPLLYYLLVSVASAFFVLLWRSTAGSMLPVEPFMADEPLAPLIQFFFDPFAALILLLVGVLALHLLVLALAEHRREVRATARVFCYSWGPSAFTLLPILGPPVGFVWSIVLLVIGVREAHRTSSPRASAIVLVPILTLLLLLTTLFLMLMLAVEDGLEW